MSDTINVGDRVYVFFERVEAEMNVEVLGIPNGPGDSWRLKRMNGALLYVQTFSKMVRTLEAVKKVDAPEGTRFDFNPLLMKDPE